MTKLHKSRIALWVKALRSRKYQQGRGWLHPTEKTYCCLGVACEVYRKETGRGEWVGEDEHQGAAFTQGKQKGSVQVLPDFVGKWFGLPNGSTEVGDEDLVALNDFHEWSFKRIATAIEKEFLKPTKE